MMYRMKNIIRYDENIDLPKCMYAMKNPTIFKEDADVDINVSNQVIKFLKGQNNKMTELEHRQDELLKKLDILYDRIKTISAYCNVNSSSSNLVTFDKSLPDPEEVALTFSPDNLPYYLNVILKQSPGVNVTWHIHSSVPNEKASKIKNFVASLPNIKNTSKVNLRLIFKNVSADTELKLSSLALPIVGNVNILRYLAFVYPNVVPYNPNDHNVDNLLDLCHLLERTSEKKKETLVNKLFLAHKDWLNGNNFSIADLAAYNVIKQWKTTPKYVPKAWVQKCEKLC